MLLMALKTLFLLKNLFFGGKSFNTKVFEPSLAFSYHREHSDGSIVSQAARQPHEHHSSAQHHGL